MRDLKLYLADFQPKHSSIKYSIEDENGDQVDHGKCITDVGNMYNMDFFLLGYLPKLMSKGDNIEVMGPVSENLISILDKMQMVLITSGMKPFAVSTVKIKGVDTKSKLKYDKQDIKVIAEVYLKNEDLGETLNFVFKYYS